MWVTLLQGRRLARDVEKNIRGSHFYMTEVWHETVRRTHVHSTWQKPSTREWQENIVWAILLYDMSQAREDDKNTREPHFYTIRVRPQKMTKTHVGHNSMEHRPGPWQWQEHMGYNSRIVYNYRAHIYTLRIARSQASDQGEKICTKKKRKKKKKKKRKRKKKKKKKHLFVQ